MTLSRLAGALATLALIVVLGGAPTAGADWPTYHGNAARTGVDSSSTGSVPFAPAWTSQPLGGDIYAEPLIYRGLVVIATESDDVYALNESTGRLVWHVNLGSPVPASNPPLPCGDISPTVGITSTPVIDPASGTLFVVGDLWDGTHAHHELFAYQATTGKTLWSERIDPTGSTPELQLQRAGLNLSGGRVLIGFGGNAGDCGSYWGWLVSVSEVNHSIVNWKAPTAKGDAVWATGGPSVDAAGNVYFATGNGASTSTADYDFGDSLLKFGPALNFLDYFAPSSWASDNQNDLDLASSSPALLPGGLVYQDGKNGNGYLLSTTSLGHLSGHPFVAPVCASFGADAYQAGVLYVACDDGIRALSIDSAARTFSVRWQGPGDANGPPIIAGGLVWVTGYTDAQLYGLNPATGTAVVTRSTPAMEHFTSPSASDGKLFLATGRTVEAWTIARPPPPPPPPPVTPSPPVTAPAVVPTCGCHGKRCRTRLALVRVRHARVTRARVYLGGKLVASERGHRLRHISFASPRHVRSFTIRLVETTNHHRRHTFRIRFSDCRRVRARA